MTPTLRIIINSSSPDTARLRHERSSSGSGRVLPDTCVDEDLVIMNETSQITSVGVVAQHDRKFEEKAELLV